MSFMLPERRALNMDGLGAGALPFLIRGYA